MKTAEYCDHCGACMEQYTYEQLIPDMLDNHLALYWEA